MQNGDFPGNGAKSLDYRRILHYKKGYENHNGGEWTFGDFPRKNRRMSPGFSYVPIPPHSHEEEKLCVVVSYVWRF